ncbi:MAG: NYN domain-containing protein [Candidatus Omnitrophota bacterium]|nr:NYN domain-containing protein [Candidatus Omnitrophota bacterium]
MSVHFILDGYNIVKQTKFINSTTLKAGREGLLSFIENYHPQGSFKNKVTIVFDGKKDINIKLCSSIPEVIFTKGETADAYIKRIVEKVAFPKNVVVVTNDRELEFFVRRSGAKIMSVNEFLLKAKINKSKDLEQTLELPSYVSDKITSELKQLWLKDR